MQTAKKIHSPLRVSNLRLSSLQNDALTITLPRGPVQTTALLNVLAVELECVARKPEEKAHIPLFHLTLVHTAETAIAFMNT
jgi:hypothetical protein